MGFKEDMQAFEAWKNQSLEFQEACVEWFSQNANCRHCVSDKPIWPDSAVLFMCEWAKTRPHNRRDWKGCWNKGRKQKMLFCKNEKAVSTRFSNVQNDNDPQHWIYKEVFGNGKGN